MIFFDLREEDVKGSTLNKTRGLTPGFPERDYWNNVSIFDF